MFLITYYHQKKTSCSLCIYCFENITGKLKANQMTRLFMEGRTIETGSIIVLQQKSINILSKKRDCNLKKKKGKRMIFFLR